jgi:small subunit ribosomal protein S6
VLWGHSPEGGEVLNKYESIYIIRPSLNEEGKKTVITKFKDLLEGSAQLESINEWGKRRLAYLINNFQEGYYVLMNFSANSSFISELERMYKITDDIIKYIIIRKD